MRPQGLIDVLSQQGYFFFQITYLRGTGFLRSFESARNSTGKLPTYAYRSPRTATIGTNSIGVTKRQTPIHKIHIHLYTKFGHTAKSQTSLSAPTIWSPSVPRSSFNSSYKPHVHNVTDGGKPSEEK